MADGPTVVNTGGGGSGAIVAIVLILLIVGAFFFFGGFALINGKGGNDVNVKIDAPAISAPAKKTGG
jgi:hypothetical protein